MKRNLPGQYLRDISLRYAKETPSRFYTTGIADLDAYTGGLPSGEMTLIAARPGVGKTSMAMQILEHVCAYHEVHCGIFSMEMTGRALVTRMVLARTALPSLELRQGRLTSQQIKIRDKALSDISQLPIIIDDSEKSSMQYIRRTAHQWVRGGIRMLALDYIQLMTTGRQGSGDTRAGLLGECARTLKSVAKKEDVPFLVLCQLNRESEKGKRNPTLADLKDSGDIEQVADNVILVSPDKQEEGTCDLLLPKWRNGRVGTVTVRFNGERTTFENLRKENR